MRRTTGIGGIFYKARDPAALANWYRDHLGVPLESWGGAVFRWADDSNPAEASTTWSLMPESSDYFAPSTARFMVNFRVEALQPLLELLRSEGCTVDDKVEESEYGKFGWVMDPEGNRVELWEPPPGKS